MLRNMKDLPFVSTFIVVGRCSGCPYIEVLAGVVSDKHFECCDLFASP